MFTKRKKTNTPHADRVAELKDQRARLEDELAQNRVAIGRARLDDPDALDGLRETMDRLERELAELAAAMPEAESRAAKGREAARVRGVKGEIRRIERVEAERKRKFRDVLRALEHLEAVCVEYEGVEKPPMLVSSSGATTLQRQFLVDLQRTAPTFKRMFPGSYLSYPMEKTETGTDEHFTRCAEVAVRRLRERLQEAATPTPTEQAG